MIRVASFDFSENVLLAELYGQSLRQAGLPVEMVSELGTREILEPALEQGRVDFVADYVGTALEFIDPDNPATHESARQAHDALTTAMNTRGIAVLDQSVAQDQNGFAVTRETAASLSAPTLSALAAAAPALVLGAPPECPDRPYCQLGLESVYALTFASFEPMESRAATATALETGEIDVGLLETTDPRLAGRHLVLLQDDRGLQPFENIVPLVRQEIADHYGDQLRSAVAAVTSRLTTAVLVELNRRVQIGGEDPAAVAADWLGQA